MPAFTVLKVQGEIKNSAYNGDMKYENIEDNFTCFN